MPAPQAEGSFPAYKYPSGLSKYGAASLLILRPVLQKPVRKPAWLGTSAAVPAAPTDHTAHQTLPGIAIAQRSVDKAFDLTLKLLFDLANLIQSQFSGRYDPGHAQLL